MIDLTGSLRAYPEVSPLADQGFRESLLPFLAYALQYEEVSCPFCNKIEKGELRPSVAFPKGMNRIQLRKEIAACATKSAAAASPRKGVF